MNPHIIGLTGSFGSGCSYIADNILVPKGYDRYSLSDELKEIFRTQMGKQPEEAARHELQDFGDKLREEEGSDFLSRQVIAKITEACKNENKKKFVVDSIRNPSEISAFRKQFERFFLFGVYADRKTRWERVGNRYHGHQDEFERDDSNDTGEDNPEHGQHVGDCFYESDIVVKNDIDFDVIGNDAFQAFQGTLEKYFQLTYQPLKRQAPIRHHEALMAMAYALSQRSSCLKRKVGAVITDPFGNVISSGFNEVPQNEKPCESRYRKCFRNKVRDDFFQQLSNEVPDIAKKEKDLKTMFQKQFKILDYCRSLHAEENAIVNLARNGRSVPLEKCTLYSTTYPCRMCANKIAEVGIGRVVYLEPYPDPEAKVILEKGAVTDEPFQGVTFKAYFRVYGEER